MNFATFNIFDPANCDRYSTTITLTPFAIKGSLDKNKSVEPLIEIEIVSKVNEFIRQLKTLGYDVTAIYDGSFNFTLEFKNVFDMVLKILMICETDTNKLINDILWKPDNKKWREVEFEWSFKKASLDWGDLDLT